MIVNSQKCKLKVILLQLYILNIEIEIQDDI